MIDFSISSLSVAPYMGAWIETDLSNLSTDDMVVAPYMGAWIETTFPCHSATTSVGRSLHGGVD